ncbi:unnamed protein product [Ilex paraguariensis]|uniref:Uncharacterized protein n=1 Tax=Ilex paraguariensis TaxID=185542 RepID=A0ABC8SCF4_9AQUA
MKRVMGTGWSQGDSDSWCHRHRRGGCGHFWHGWALLARADTNAASEVGAYIVRVCAAGTTSADLGGVYEGAWGNRRWGYTGTKAATTVTGAVVEGTSTGSSTGIEVVTEGADRANGRAHEGLLEVGHQEGAPEAGCLIVGDLSSKGVPGEDKNNVTLASKYST